MLDWLACTLVNLISSLLCRLPPSVAVWCGAQLGGFASWCQPKRTQIGLNNLRAAFDGQLTPRQAHRVIRRCYQQLGSGILELLRLPVMDRAYVDRYITVEGRQHVEAALASGRPVIFLTGHYGNWELSSIIAALEGYPIVALARAQDHLPKLYKLLVSYRESKGCTIVHKGGAMKRLIAALGEQKLVGIVADQASRQGLFIKFFGRPALFAKGPFELAYDRHAVILPAFIHRVRGPFHRLVIESPITLPEEATRLEAVREGIEQFARQLTRHITEDPSQWLWMHKRWKHTPARRVLVLSDGKAGHLRQSLAVVEALREHQPQVSHDVVEVHYRHPMARALALLWSWWAPAGWGGTRCLQLTLSPQTASILLSRSADLIVSCGAATVPANLLWAAENHAKSLTIMNPAPIPLRRFDLVIAPRHDGLPARSNLVQTDGAIMHRMDEERLLQASRRLRAHPSFRSASDGERRHPIVSVFIGGDTPAYELTSAFAEALIKQVMAACEATDGWCLVTSSRRTSPVVERLLTERVGSAPRCRLLLIASRDQLNGTMEGMLGCADVAVVTGESISMISEACASGRSVLVVEPPLRQAGQIALTKHQRFLRDVAHQGYVRVVPMPEVGLAIERALKEHRPTKRLDTFGTIREAVAHLL